MNNEMTKIATKHIVFYLSIAVLIISLTFKASYAFYSVVLVGNENVTPTVVDTADLKLTFLEGESNYISATDMIILSQDEIATKAETATFKIQNNGSVAAKYNLSFDITLTSNLISNDFKWQLTVGGNTYRGNFGGITKPVGDTIVNVTDNVVMTPELTLAKDAIANCELKLWLEETNQNQIELTEGTFSGSVRVTAIN